MRRAFLALILSGVLVALSCVGSGRAAVPLAVTISGQQMVAPGRVGFNVTIVGLQPDLTPTIEGTVTVGGGQAIHGPRAPVPAARIPAAIDLRAGKVRVGGDASVVEFAPVPPFEENTSIDLEVTVRQAADVATARQSSMLLLPTVIVPGYLNDLGGKPGGLVSFLEQRGYHATTASPDLFWFSYRSRALGLKDAARALAAYVREVVLPETYATRINVVGYSLGGLLTRWNLAFEPGWDHLVNRFVMVGVPNQGAVASYVYAWYAIGSLARTAAARDLIPTFPFWQPVPGAPWRLPPDGQNPTLAELNTHPLPYGPRVYAFYGNQGPLDPRDRGTWAGVAGDLQQLQNAVFSSGPGDGFVLTASALGLPINGGGGISGLVDRLVMKVDLGAVGHMSLLNAASPKIADVLTDRMAAFRPGPSMGQKWQRLAQGAPNSVLGFPLEPVGFLIGTGHR